MASHEHVCHVSGTSMGFKGMYSTVQYSTGVLLGIVLALQL